MNRSPVWRKGGSGIRQDRRKPRSGRRGRKVRRCHGARLSGRTVPPASREGGWGGHRWRRRALGDHLRPPPGRCGLVKRLSPATFKRLDRRPRSRASGPGSAHASRSPNRPPEGPSTDRPCRYHENGSARSQLRQARARPTPRSTTPHSPSSVRGAGCLSLHRSTADGGRPGSGRRALCRWSTMPTPVQPR